ncbi:MAG TPA: hypothetical protein VK590_01955, partial [Saprospiraceae bacterium]|nr:hypothetical protein [Saprospiraceae bacterium]
AYTYSKTDRKFKDINNGIPFPVTYDRTHDLNVVVNYQLSRKWECGGVFVFTTGNTYTPLKSLFLVEQELNIEYGTRNSERIAPYHRLDLSFTYTPHPESTRKFTSSWNFSIYNVYNRLNPSFIYNDINTNIETGEANIKAIKVSLFPMIPSITWNFKWK